MLRPIHLAAVMLLSGPAVAQEHVIQDHRNAVCVTCAEPDRTYRCKAAAAEQHQLFLKNRELIRLACIKDIADSNGHGGCRVSKNQPVFCDGQPYAVNVTDLARQLTGRRPVQSERPANPPSQAQAKPAKPNEPKTVIDLAKQTAKQTEEQIVGAGEAMKNAGKAVGGTVEKTWRCLTSLFADC